MKVIFLLLLLQLSTIRSDEWDDMSDEEYWDSLDVDIDDLPEDDGSVLDSSPNPTEVKATIANPSSVTMDIYFRVDSTAPISHFFELAPSNEQVLNTFQGHTIYACVQGTQQVVHTWVMDRNQDMYAVDSTIDELSGNEFVGIPVPDLTGGDRDNSMPQSIATRAINDFDFAIDIYWLGNDEERFVFTIEPKNALNNINTFIGHNFIAKEFTGSKIVATATVRENEDVVFGPIGGASNTLDDDDSLELDEYDDEDDDLEDDEDETWDDLDWDELDADDIELTEQTCDGIDGTCEAGLSDAPRSKMEPLLSVWNKKQLNPYAAKTYFVVKFRNLFSKKIQLFRDDEKVKSLQKGASTVILVQEKDSIIWQLKGNVVKESVIRKDQPFYVLEGDNAKWNTLHEQEMEFAKNYYAKTGLVWLSPDNIPKPTIKFWPASQVGHKSRFSTFNSKIFTCGVNEAMNKDCFEKKSGRTKLKAISVSPRVLEVEGFLNDKECDYLLTLKGMPVKKGRSIVTEQIFNRVGDLHRKHVDLLDKAVKEIELLEIEANTELTPSINYDVRDCTSIRLATLILFLNVPQNGGALTIPNTDVSVSPKLGHGVLIYNQLSNGNADALASYSISTAEEELNLAFIHLWEPKSSCDKSLKRFN